MFIGLQKAGAEVTVMTFGDSAYVRNFQEAGIRVIDFHPSKKISFSQVKKIRKELKQGGYDILHLFNSKAIINGLLAASGLPVKVVLYRGFTGHVKWYDPTAYFKFLSPGVDSIICVSDSVARDLENEFVFGGKQKLTVIRKGHKPEWYRDIVPLDLRKELKLEEGAYFVTCVANARPMKGIPYLIEAFDQLPKEAPIHLLLIGNGMDAPDFQSMIQSNANREKIHVMGFQENPLSLVAGSDVFVLPSTKGEGLSKVVIEAMSLGVTPIVTAILANKALVFDQENGLKVPPADPKALSEAIYLLYRHQESSQKLAAAAKKHIETNLHLDTSVQQTLALYKSLLGE
jgi:glycosyltransferase involved in cell wall biosynthesis